MNEKVTTHICPYPKGDEPNYIIPMEYRSYRFALGKDGRSPLIAICMNPSAAKEASSDHTINRIIKISKDLGMDGWIVFNLYPERATNSNQLGTFSQSLSDKNNIML